MAHADHAPAVTGCTAPAREPRAEIWMRQRGARRQAFYRCPSHPQGPDSWASLPVPAADKALRVGVLDMGAGFRVPVITSAQADAEAQREQMDRREFDNIHRGLNAERSMPELPFCIPESWSAGGSYWLAYPRAPLAAELYDVMNPGASISSGYLATVDDFGFLVRVSGVAPSGAKS